VSEPPAAAPPVGARHRLQSTDGEEPDASGRPEPEVVDVVAGKPVVADQEVEPGDPPATAAGPAGTPSPAPTSGEPGATSNAERDNTIQ
jgi:hypothetical protein